MESHNAGESFGHMSEAEESSTVEEKKKLA